MRIMMPKNREISGISILICCIPLPKDMKISRPINEVSPRSVPRHLRRMAAVLSARDQVTSFSLPVAQS